jgi:hypothetical protein
MNFIGLFLQGVSAMSIYVDIILARILVAACSVATLTLVFMLGVIFINFGTSLAIPGWASYLTASLIILFVQAMLLAVLVLFQLFTLRSLKPFVPALDSATFIVDESVDPQVVRECDSR